MKASSKKRKYSKPKFTKHGDIRGITKGTGTEGPNDYGWGCS